MDLEQTAIGRIQLASQMSLTYYKQPIMICISGGKDSDVLLELTRRAGVPFEIQHSHTTVDAPQTVYHVRDIFRRYEQNGIKCTLDKPKMTMWELIVHKKMPPTRLVRYCCSYLKEQHGKNRHILTGVRWDESISRKNKRGIYEDKATDIKNKIIITNDNDDKRRLTERCQVLASTITNPIVDWKDKDVWDFIDSEHIKCNPLYGCGFKRVGCIGCPVASKSRKMEFKMFPTYKRAYIRAFDKMLEARKAAGLKNNDLWRDGKSVFRWWMEEKFNPDQLSFEGFDEEYGEDDDR